MADPFRSQRLIYRAVNSPADDAFVQEVVEDPIAWQNSMVKIARPANKQDVAKFVKHLDECLLGVIICLPAPKAESGASPPIPIGIVHLGSLDAGHSHHRHSELGIDIIKAHQGKGYGSEAIGWALTWAFKTGGLHRVYVTCFEWNTGARRLYERLGFKQEEE